MAKPKPKSDEEKKAALSQMLSLAETTNHLTSAAPAAHAGSESVQETPPTPATTPDNQEQKGENASVAPTPEAAVPAASEPATSPALEVPSPEPTALTPAPVPTPEPEPKAPAPAAAAATKDNDSAVEPSPGAIPDSVTTVEVGAVELASLFKPSADKKVFTMRLTDAHYQYLLLLGTIVGNGASAPDIVHNIIEHFIDKNDQQIQKAIAKQLRQRQAKK
ncbi:hypothetical protein GCM10027594_00430 [Hymenobacter agri]|uniref:DUF3408 domain-containing protein n=1 Tax=Hymenobacter jeollabukensis TaxID=2025313 RepID=A0A5R8WIL0_9BACT|nr:hypothetical protein [Hymenobacter jeollabukensis]TLM88510.1 hypothetical protein FDY95_24420 [Hymenobacter jeollabukensis]